MDYKLKLQRILLANLPKQATDLILYHETRRLARKRMRAHRGKTGKPHPKLHAYYKNYRMLIRLRHWCMTHQANSLIRAGYSSHPRNPE